jgi:hypothetical protein
MAESQEARRIAEAVRAAKFEGHDEPIQPLTQEAVALWVGYAKRLAEALLTEQDELREAMESASKIAWRNVEWADAHHRSITREEMLTVADILDRALAPPVEAATDEGER